MSCNCLVDYFVELHHINISFFIYIRNFRLSSIILTCSSVACRDKNFMLHLIIPMVRSVTYMSWFRDWQDAPSSYDCGQIVNVISTKLTYVSLRNIERHPSWHQVHLRRYHCDGLKTVWDKISDSWMRLCSSGFFRTQRTTGPCRGTGWPLHSWRGRDYNSFKLSVNLSSFLCQPAKIEFASC